MAKLRKTVTAREAMQLLGVKSRATISEYIERGWIEARTKSPKPGSDVLVYLDSIESFLKQREIKPKKGKR